MADFTTWAALRDELKNALMALASGSPYTQQYTISGRTHIVRTASDIKAMIEMTYELESIENGGADTDAYYEAEAY